MDVGFFFFFSPLLISWIRVQIQPRCPKCGPHDGQTTRNPGWRGYQRVQNAVWQSTGDGRAECYLWLSLRDSISDQLIPFRFLISDISSYSGWLRVILFVSASIHDLFWLAIFALFTSARRWRLGVSSFCGCGFGVRASFFSTFFAPCHISVNPLDILHVYICIYPGWQFSFYHIFYIHLSFDLRLSVPGSFNSVEHLMIDRLLSWRGRPQFNIDASEYATIKDPSELSSPSRRER